MTVGTSIALYSSMRTLVTNVTKGGLPPQVDLVVRQFLLWIGIAADVSVYRGVTSRDQ